MNPSMPARAASFLLLALLSCAPARGQGLQLLEVRQEGNGSTPAAGAQAPAADPEIEDLVALARRTRTTRTEWSAGQPLPEARNAHLTTTKERMKDALEKDYNFLEGDVRQEINPPYQLEVRHDTCQETGDNLTLRQWLAVGLASGRGLKLDVKEPQHMARVIEAVSASGVPEGRLMINLGFGAMKTWGPKVRERFPGAWLAINPPEGDGKLDATRADAMLALGRRLGGPVTFVVRFDLLTAATLAALEAGGPVSVWNSTATGPKVKDAAALIRTLRAHGVTGVVDIRPSQGLGARVATAVDRVANEIRTRGEGLVRSVVRAIPGL